MRRRLIIGLLTLLIFIGLAGLGLHALVRWNWGGPYLLDIMQARINGKITAGQISGNPFTGITYKDFVIEGSDGQVFLKTASLELRLSLSSLAAGHLILANLSFSSPLLHAVQVSGHWNFEKLLKPVAPPPAAPGFIDRIKTSFLQQIDLTKLMIDRGEILLIRNGRPMRYHDLTLNSSLTILNSGKPEQEIKVNQAEMEVVAPQGRVQFSTHLTYRAGLAKIDQFELELAGEHILSLQGELCRPANGLSCQATGRLGPIKGAKIREFWDRWPAAWGLASEFKYRGTPKGANLQTQCVIGQARLDLQGEFETRPAVFKLKGSLHGLTTGQLKEIQGLRAEKVKGLSPVNARLDLQGTGLPWNPESMEGALTLEPFRFRDVKVSQLHLTLKGDAQRQDFQGRVEGNFGQVSVKSQGHLLPIGKDREIRGALALQTKNFQPALLGLPEYAGTELTSAFSGTFRLPPDYSTSRLYLAGDLTANGRLNHESLKSLQAKFSLSGERLDIARAEMRLAAGDATVNGMISRSGVDLTFTAAIANSRNLPVRPAGTFSSLTANGTVRGVWKSLQIDLAAQARQLTFHGTALQSASLKANLSGWPPQSGNLALHGVNLKTRAGTFSRLALNAQGQGGSWEFRLAATSPKYPHLELAGSADLRSRPMSLQIARVSWQSQGLTVKNKAPFQVRFLPGWEISAAAFQVDGGTVSVQAKAGGKELTGRVEVQNLNAELIEPSEYKVTGKLGGRVTLSGTPQVPLINANFTLASGQIQDINIKTLSTTLSYSADHLQTSGYLEGGPQHSRLTWKGTVPVKFSVIPFQFVLENQGLDLQVQSEKINLSLLKAFTPEIQSAEAPVDMLVSAKGDPHQPQVSGYVRWGAGWVQPRLAGLAYKLNPGEARLQGYQVAISAITLESQGTLTLSGNLNLKGASRVETRLQGFQVMNRGGSQIWLDGAIHLSGPLSHLVAGGQITVPKALLRPTLFSGGLDPDVVVEEQKTAAAKARPKPSPYQNMQIDLPITSHGNVVLKDPKGQADLAVALKVTKKPGQDLAMGGTIRAIKGTLTIENNPFKVVRALVTMPGVPDKPILLDVKAIHQMDNRDITLVLLVTGTTANPQISLESAPPMPPEDCLSYLIFGGPAASLTKEQYLAMGAQGVGGALTNQKVGQLLGAALPYLSKSGASGPSAGIRKEITKNVSVSYGRKLNEITGQYESQAVIEYKVNRHLSVDSQIAPRNTGADVLYNYEW
jgi:autotransporter translocation and assembly factor TamB